MLGIDIDVPGKYAEELCHRASLNKNTKIKELTNEQIHGLYSEMKTFISPIIQVCDAISGARPGARRQVLDSYIQRLKDLEEIAFGFGGVQKAYAIQAGRELRVMVESEKVSDEKAAQLSFEISQKIQTDMTYPGQVKVTVIRETRSVHLAK